MTKRVLITGGTGLVGKHLSDLMLKQDYSISFLSRHKTQIPNIQVYQWDIEKCFIEPEAIAQADYIIHLAGAGVAEKSWTEARKKEILESRTKSTELLAQQLKTIPNQVKAFISASAIGIYGLDTGEKLLKEDAPFGNDFLAEVTKSWEKSIDLIDNQGIRTVKLRIGIVLAKEGGALVKLAQPIRLGAGAALGSGKQYMSWIHIEDLAQMFLYSLENELITGAYNAVGVNPATNAELTKVVAKVLGMPLILPNVPSFAMKLLLGEMAAIVLGGNKVSNEKILKSGFQLKYTDLETALKNLLKP